ncbi:MAG: DUF448 domain-containing protein [Myxococcota bacterium]
MTTSPDNRSERTCAGCRSRFPREALLRLSAVDEAPYLVPDRKGKLGGRGVWVGATVECIEAAVKKGGFARSLRRGVKVDADTLIGLLHTQLERRFYSLVGGAARSGHIAYGTDAVRESMAKRRIHVLGVAVDAAGRRDELSRRAERVAIFGTKRHIGELFRKDEVAVYSIEDVRIGNEVLRLAEQLAGLRHADAFTYEDGGKVIRPVLGDRKHA